MLLYSLRNSISFNCLHVVLKTEKSTTGWQSILWDIVNPLQNSCFADSIYAWSTLWSSTKGMYISQDI